MTTQQWEVSWSNLYDAENFGDLLGQVIPELTEAVVARRGATILVAKNMNTGRHIIYDIQTMTVVSDTVPLDLV